MPSPLLQEGCRTRGVSFDHLVGARQDRWRNGEAERLGGLEVEGEGGRWRGFTREQIAARNDNLDISWLRDTAAEAEEQLTEPEDIAAAIIGHLKAAQEEIETLSEEFEPEENAAAAVAWAAE